VNYREGYGLFACCGILFNHESPRRGETFVTRKITRAVTRIKCGLQDKLHLGNLEAKRDWGFAGDYVRAMWLMLQADEPDDYVVATGQTSTVNTFLAAAMCAAELGGLDPVVHDARYERPNEIDVLCGDSTMARLRLGWEPTVALPQLVRMMVDSDMKLAEGEAIVKNFTLKPRGRGFD
jgi:GDPmannose 4,6-dehydratase